MRAGARTATTQPDLMSLHAALRLQGVRLRGALRLAMVQLRALHLRFRL